MDIDMTNPSIRILSSVALAAFAFSTSAAEMVVESVDGPVTQNEITAFKTFMAARPASSDNIGNDWVYGDSGKDTESLGMVYEISKDTALLDQMIRFADAALACRNDPASGRIVWTGKRELCWPNKAENAVDGKYSGSENGDVIAHIGYCAELILKTPAVWKIRVPIGDPHHYGATYGERAETYIREMDRTIDSFILPNFVSAKDTNHYRWPESDLYRALGPRYQTAPGNAVPWNQQTMLSGGFLRLEQCHELLKDDPARVKKYNEIVRANMDWFLADLHPAEKNGHAIYDWGYSLGRKSEDVPHGGYDIWGLCRAYDSGKFGVSSATMTNFANTLYYVIYDPANKTFHMRVDGTDASKAARSSPGASWSLLSQYFPNDNLYRAVTTANLVQAKTRPLEQAFILWMKYKRSLGIAH
jgi:hypothetical protein